MGVASIVSFRSRFPFGRALAALALSGGLSLTTGIASAQSFSGLGFLPPTGTETYGRGVNSDGSVVVGLANPGDGTYNRAFQWTGGGGMAELGMVPGGSAATARAVTGDGSVTVGWTGYLTHSRACLWTGGGVMDLGTLPGGTTSYAYDVSDNGGVAVGYSNNAQGYDRAVRWAGGTMTDLGTLRNGYVSRAYGVSGNGSVIVGSTVKSSTWVAFRWTAAGGMVSLGSLKNGKPSEAWAASTDGSVIVGYSGTSTNERAFRWTGGSMTNLGALPGISHSYALSVSGNGAAVVGFGSNQAGSPSGRAVPPPTTNRAFLWTSGGGMVDLQAHLTSLGLGADLTGWTLTEARDITADGSIIVGSGWHNGQPEAWVANLQ